MITLSKIKKLPIAEFGLAFLALLFLFPGPYHTIPELDASWQVVLEEAFFNHWQFGKDIIFTGGPLSFLYSPTSIGYFPKSQVVAEATILFFAILAIFFAVRKQPIWVHIMVFVCIFCGANTSRDGIYLVSITAASFQLLKSDSKFKNQILLIVFIAILGMVKFTLGILGASCLGVICCLRLWEKKKNEGFKIFGTYLISACIIWMAIGQSLWNLPAFIKHSWSVSQGYPWAMHLQEPGNFFFGLLLILSLACIPVFVWTLLNRGKAICWAVFLVSAISLFLSWKTGITRFGGHITFFLQAAALVPLLLLPFLKNKKIGYAWVGVNFAIFLLAFFSTLPTGKEQLIQRAIAQSTFGLRFIGSAGKEVRKFADLVPHVKSSHTLHRIKERIGDDTVDMLYYRHGILLLNELNYLPRPTIQNYTAYNNHLAQWNLDHMRETPPKYILCRDGVVDNRYPTVDDNLFIREVLSNYLPVLTEDEYLLLERAEKPQAFVDKHTLLSTKVISGQSIDISEFSEHTLWLKVNYHPRLAHKIVALLYKPEFLYLNVTTVEGVSASFRLIGETLENGFLLSPKLGTTIEIQNFLSSKLPLTRIREFSIHSVPGNSLFPTEEFEIELIQLERELTTNN